MSDWLLTDEKIRSVKAKELVIYREEDIVATAVDKALINAQAKELVEHLIVANKEGLFIIKDEVWWQALKKEVGLEDAECPNCKGSGIMMNIWDNTQDCIKCNGTGRLSNKPLANPVGYVDK